jgi:RNA polymerase sigma-70 factor (ECF subfamily)
MKRRKGRFEPERELSLEELLPRGGEGPASEIPDVSDLPDRELERSELREAVQRAIRDLPPHYRIVLVMRDLEQLTTKEVAEALGLAESAVKMRLHRARLMVRQRLEGPEP